MLDKTRESIVEAYLSGILYRTGASMVCLSDNGSELKNTQMNTVLKHIGIKHIFSSPYRPQGSSHIENVHNFLKQTLTKFYLALMPNETEYYHLLATVLTLHPQLMTWRVCFSSSMAETCWKDVLDYLDLVTSDIWVMTKESSSFLNSINYG